MANITLSDLTTTLEETRTTLLSAMNGDGIVSRADLKQLLEQTEAPLKRRFLEFFYGFLRRLEDRPGMRVTEAVIDNGIAFIKAQIIPNLEIQVDFSPGFKQKIVQIHKLAYPLAMELFRATSPQKVLSPREVSEQIDHLKDGLYFDDYGSEAAIPIASFFLAYTAPTLTPEAFVRALGLDPATPQRKSRAV